MINSDQVMTHLGIGLTDADTAALTLAVSAVNAKVNRWHGYTDDAEWTPAHTLGAVMLAAHLYRRRNTPGGVEQFNELGVAYVQRSDPHVSMLLGLGGWEQPKVG